MDVEAVLVSLRLEGTPNWFESSGIFLESGLVLVTGTALLPLVQEEREWVSSLVGSSSPSLAPNEHISRVSFRVFREGHGGELLPAAGEVVGGWKCPLVARSVDDLLSDWTLGHVSHGDETRGLSAEAIEASKELISTFIVVKCGHTGEDPPEEALRVLWQLLPELQEPRRGEEVEVVSTPFGNHHFVNSCSRGVVGNVMGQERCIILFDARTVSGCEGGPIFAGKRSRKNGKERGELMGLVACPLTWWRGEWVGLTIGISLSPVLKRLLRAPGNSPGFPPAYSGSPDPLSGKRADDTVVLVRSGPSWGSGVVLDAASGTIVTCSHVVRNEKMVSVFHKGNELLSRVIFRSSDDTAYDLAVLETREKSPFECEAEFSKEPPEIGETVTAVGFPLFSERNVSDIRPTLVSGCISRINPYMIQTTCCIQSGFSGGALLRDGKLLGIIVSNTKNSAAALFPHINFVVPSSRFREPVLRYIKTKDAENLRDLECSDQRAQIFWSLKTSKL